MQKAWCSTSSTFRAVGPSQRICFAVRVLTVQFRKRQGLVSRRAIERHDQTAPILPRFDHDAVVGRMPKIGVRTTHNSRHDLIPARRHRPVDGNHLPNSITGGIQVDKPDRSCSVGQARRMTLGREKSGTCGRTGCCAHVCSGGNVWCQPRTPRQVVLVHGDPTLRSYMSRITTLIVYMRWSL